MLEEAIVKPSLCEAYFLQIVTLLIAVL